MQTLLQIFNEEYTCPILRTPIQDPVLTLDGHTYERQAIENWFKTSQKSPITGVYLDDKILISNIALKNVMSKISNLIPKQLKKLNKLQSQNQKLKMKLQQTNHQLAYTKQVNISKQLLMKESMKQLENKQKTLNEKFSLVKNKNLSIQQLQEKIQSLQQKIQQLTKLLQSQKKLKEKKVVEFTQKFKIYQKDSKQNIKKIKSNYEICFSSLDKSIKNTLVVLTLILYFFHENISKNEQMNSLKKNMIKIQQEIQKKLHNTYTSTHINIYNNNKFLVQNMLKKNTIFSQFMIYPRIYFESGEYYRANQVISVQSLIQFEQRIEGQSNNYYQQQKEEKDKQLHEYKPKNLQNYKKFINNITGIQNQRYDKTSDQDWQKILTYAALYSNISSIVLLNSYISEIKKKDLYLFPKLKYLELRENRLDEQSIRQIQLYNEEYPHVVIVLSKAQTTYNNYQYDYEDQYDYDY